MITNYCPQQQKHLCTQGYHASWKILEFLLENFQDLESPGERPWSWKVSEIYLQGHGKSWNLLGSDVLDSFWFQIDMFMQTKIPIIVFIRYVFWAAGMPKMLTVGVPPRTTLAELTVLFQTPQLLFVAIFKHCWLTSGSWKMFLGPGKVLEFFCNQGSGKPVYSLIKCKIVKTDR